MTVGSLSFDRDPMVKVAIVNALKTPENSELVEKCAASIASKYLRGKTLAEAMYLFVAVCCAIDVVKVQKMGQNASTKVSNQIMRLVAANYIRTLSSVSAEDFKTVEAFQTSEDLKDKEWSQIKLRVFNTLLQNYSRLLTYAGSIEIPPTFRSLANDVVVNEARENSLMMLQGLSALRRYGLKSSYFEDGMCHSPGQVWVFTDPEDYREIMGDGRGDFVWRDVIAMINLADKSDVVQGQRLAPVPIPDAIQDSVVGARVAFPCHFLWSLNSKGGMDAAIGGNTLPVFEVFQKLGKEAEYYGILLANVLRLYDLTVPVEIVASVPAIPKVPSRLSSIFELVWSKRVEMVADLFVPRMRYLERGSALESLLEKEIERADEETKRRTLRKHDVIWHIRRLPLGRHPTKMASDLAYEQGIVLAENETFVRKHTRGKENETPLIHRAKSRV